MKKFISILFFLIGTLLIMYAIPFTRHFLPDFTGTENTGNGQRTMIVIDDSIHFVKLLGGGVICLTVLIINLQKIKLQSIEISEKTGARAMTKKKK